MRALGTIDGSTDTRPLMIWKRTQQQQKTTTKKTPYLDSPANLLASNSQNCPTLQVVSVCTPCCIWLHAIVYFWKLLPKVRHWSKFWANNLQHFFCFMIAEAWHNSVGSAIVCTALSTLLGPRMCKIHGLQNLMGCILPTMHCRS